ncbi:hypothetical protein IT575_07600 [bacterium]|nr:hypothetical protein [bacterium]
MVRTLSTLLLCLCLCLQAACSGQRDRSTPDQDVQTLLPELGRPSGLAERLPPRSSSVAGDTVVAAGQAFEAGLPNSRVSPGLASATFFPDYPGGSGDLHGLAFAIYSLDLSSGSQSNEIRLIWDGPAPPAADVFVGLGNRVSDRWDWYAWPGDGPVNTANMLEYKDPGTGLLLVAVVVRGEVSAELKRVRVGSPLPEGPLSFEDVSAVIPVSYSYDLSAYGVPGSQLLAIDVDADGDGTYELLDQPAQADLVYSQAGLVNPRIRYSNDEGFSTELTAEVNALAGTWDLQFVYGTSDVFPCSQPSCAMVDGRPAVAFLGYDVGVDQVKVCFRRAADAEASSWEDMVPIYESGTPVSLSRIIDAGGSPALLCAFDDETLRYFRASNAQGSGWEAPVIIDTSPQPILECELALVDGTPRSAYRADFPYTTYYRRALDSAGSQWSEIEKEFLGSADSGQLDLFELQGRPALAIRYDSDMVNIIRLYHADDASGDANWTQTPIDIYGPSENFDVRGCELFGSYAIFGEGTFGPNSFVTAHFLEPGAADPAPLLDTFGLYSGSLGKHTGVDCSTAMLSSDLCLAACESNDEELWFAFNDYDPETKELVNDSLLVDSISGTDCRCRMLSVDRVPFIFYNDGMGSIKLARMQ